jgi:drug/metabolite transporter (DMT)-like permease
MDHLLLTVSAAQKHHFQEIGLVLAVVGALVIVLAGVLGLRPRSRLAEHTTMIIAGVLLAVGMALQLYGVHSK